MEEEDLVVENIIEVERPASRKTGSQSGQIFGTENLTNPVMHQVKHLQVRYAWHVSQYEVVTVTESDMQK